MRLIFRAFFNDAAMYPDPRVFRPERWLDSEGQLLDDAVSPMHPNKIIFDSTKNGAVPYLPLNKMLEGDASGVKGQGKTSDNSIKVQGQ